MISYLFTSNKVSLQNFYLALQVSQIGFPNIKIQNSHAENKTQPCTFII